MISTSFGLKWHHQTQHNDIQLNGILHKNIKYVAQAPALVKTVPPHSP